MIKIVSILEFNKIRINELPSTDLARPKSQTLTEQSSLIRTLAGLRSL